MRYRRSKLESQLYLIAITATINYKIIIIRLFPNNFSQYVGRSALASINFVTCHDGFNLADLVSYNEKHNEVNGDNNKDGANDNHSWNHGVEGDTDDKGILEFRWRQRANLLATLFLSLGVPMMLSMSLLLLPSLLPYIIFISILLLSSNKAQSCCLHPL